MNVFLAAPFTRYLVRDEDGVFKLDPHLRDLLLRLESALAAAGHSVFLAHRREEFGEKLWTGHRCTAFDLLEMQRADCVVALPEGSYGVHVELGWATAMGKPVVLILDESAEITSPLLQGLECVNETRIVAASPGLLRDKEAQVRLCEGVLKAIEGIPIRRIPETWAFLSTSFGFGPVSKAVTTAQELKRRRPQAIAHYFGAGIDHDFAVKSRAFDRIFRIDVDRRDSLVELIPQLAHYQAVFSILNLDILPSWPAGHPPLYLIDSLAWMWPSPPAGLGNVKAYFVQDYLVSEERIRGWREEFPLVVVGPIEAASLAREIGHDSSIRRLLVNFSGCANPIAPPEIFRRYVEILTGAVLEFIDKFDEIKLCCNEKLSRHIWDLLQDERSSGVVEVGHFAHNEFLKMLAGSQVVVSAPGITTTLEANAFGKSIRFLLPQNYSQALMSERYRILFGDRCCMALSRFAPEFTVSPDLPEEEGVARVVAALQHILTERQQDVRDMVGELIEDQASGEPLKLPLPDGRHWHKPGQKAIVEHVLASWAHSL